MCRSPFIYWLFLFFCGSFGEGDTPLRGAGGCCFVLRRRGGVLLRRRGGSVAGGGMKKPLSVSERRAVF